MLEKRKHRIALMGEDHIQGAGGRMSKIFSLIATAWASLEGEDQKVQSRADRQYHSKNLTFHVPHVPAYMQARRVKFDGQDFDITGMRRTFDLHPMIAIDAVLASD